MSETRGPQLTEHEAAVLESLRRHITPTSAEVLAEEFSVPLARMKRTLGGLVGKRVAKRAGGGRFTPAKHRR